MGTRSRIALETENGSVYSIYCHWDGYPAHNGKLLQEHYQDDEKIRALIDLGNLSSLAPEIGEKHDFDWHMKVPFDQRDADPRSNWCNAYGRDRGETEQDAAIDDTREAFFARCQEGWEEYAYLRVRGEWWVSAVGGDCGPFLASAVDPDGKLPANWMLLVDVLNGDVDLYNPATVAAHG